jgi:dTDP-L-rhamnose 4-epimerase
MKRVLVTGGAGFIGSHLCKLLLEMGCEVMAFDCLWPQVHPKRPEWPEYQPDQEGLVKWVGDVRDRPRAVWPAMAEFQPDTVIHLAALVGVGQSNYQPAIYTSANITGTMNLLDCIVDWNKQAQDREAMVANLDMLAEQSWQEVEADQPVDEQGNPIQKEDWIAISKKEIQKVIDSIPCLTKIQKVFIAGSMSSYGEGPAEAVEQPDGKFEFRPVATSEAWPFRPESVYAWTKAEQENGAKILARIRGLPVYFGRFFNVYGPNQALTNPYTGVAAIFSARILAGLQPIIYSDGSQSRDFVHVADVARAIVKILESGEPGESYNIGTGKATSVLSLANMLCEYLRDPEGPEIAPLMTGLERKGDIRQCFADVSLLCSLGWEPKIALSEGIQDLVAWVRSQPPAATQELLDRAHQELIQNGLLVQ